jgi:uncharacterized protein (TIGR00297 family)
MESQRKLLHMTMILFSLPTGRVPSLWMAAGCGLAFFFNATLLPRVSGRRFERTADRKKGYAPGILLYPASLAFLYLLFSDSPVFALVGWCAMAFGDAIAAWVGSRLSSPTWPWNTGKTVAGTLAFLCVGMVATLLWLLLFPPNLVGKLPWVNWVLIVGAAISVAAWVETLPGLVDDNLSVPLAAALSARFVHQALLTPLHFPVGFQWAAMAILLLGAAAFASRRMDGPGTFLGCLLATAIWLGAGWPALSALATFFLLGSLASHWGRASKQSWGLAQERNGRRSLRHALANGGAPAAAALVAVLFPLWQGPCRAAVWAALACALADTTASELGTLWGRRFVHVFSLRPAPRGQDGAISMAGTLAGTLAATTLAGLALAWGMSPMAAARLILLGAFGSWLDSALGALGQRRGWLTGDSVNFLSCAATALIAAAWESQAPSLSATSI